MALTSRQEVATRKAKLAAVTRWHGKESVGYQIAYAELEAAMRMAVVEDVARMCPDEFRAVAVQLLADEEVSDAS